MGGIRIGKHACDMRELLDAFESTQRHLLESHTRLAKILEIICSNFAQVYEGIHEGRQIFILIQVNDCPNKIWCKL